VNTYQVTYFPPGSSSPVVLTVKAVAFDYMPDVVSFIGENNEPVFAVPVSLDPVVLLVTAA
jgi:hypothetical protein